MERNQIRKIDTQILVWARKQLQWENHCDFHIPIIERFFRLKLRIRSSLDQTDFLTADSTHMILQIIRLDHEIDILKKISVLHFLLYILGFYLLVCIRVCFDLPACFSVLVGDSLVSLLIIMELFIWFERSVIFSLRSFSHFAL